MRYIMKTIFTVVFVIFAGLLLAQIESPFGKIHHSSRDAEGNLHLRWQDYSEGIGTTTCFYNTDNSIWNSVPPELWQPGTMEALVPYSFGQRLRYRLHYSVEEMGESFAMLHSACWDTNVFPPALDKMALMGTDPEGDSLMVYHPNLDLREAFVASTQDKLYCSLRNQSGVFPTMNSLSSYNVYLAMITNIEAVNDTVAYAMIYSFNIPGLISNGLYKLGFDPQTEMPVFTRLGNIQAQVVSGSLHMACNFSDLAADPDFGYWPNASQSLMLVGATMAIDIDLPTMTPNLGLGDYGVPSVVVFQDNLYQVNVNTLPNVNVQSWNEMNKQLVMIYTDLDGDFPLIASVDPYTSPAVTAYPTDPLYPGSCVYVAQFPLDFVPDVLGYSFSDNGIDIVSGTYEPVSIEEVHQTPAAIACTIPNPFIPGKSESNIAVKGLENGLLHLQLFNLKGQKIGTLYNGKVNSNTLSIPWDGRINGKNLASGVYFLRLENGKHSINHRFVIAK